MKPEQLEDFFDSICYDLFAESQGEKLLGTVNKTVLGELLRQSNLVNPGNLRIILEFPLQGQPWFEISVGGICQSLRKPEYQENEDYWKAMPYGEAYRFLVDNFSDTELQIGTTWDLHAASGQTPRPGFYASGLDNEKAVRGVLERLGREKMLPLVEKMLAKVPDTWEKYYFGFFPGRSDSPIRFGFSLQEEQINKYCLDCDLFRSDLEQIGYCDGDEAMFKEICNPVYRGCYGEIQFDMLEDGSLSSELGMGYTNFSWEESSLKDETTIQARAEDIFKHLQTLNLSDDRWKLVPGCFKQYRLLSLVCNDAAQTFVKIVPSIVKVKWKHKRPVLAKNYLKIRLL